MHVDIFIVYFCALVLASANAIWHQIQQVSGDENLYSDPSHQTHLPFPFPGRKPSDRFELHDPSALNVNTFTYMGRTRFQHILGKLPIPPSVLSAHWIAKNAITDAASGLAAAAAAFTPHAGSGSSSASPSLFFPPIPAKAASKSEVMFLYGTIGWGKSHLLAAMVCLLMRKGRKVVYLPDCKVMLDDPIKYFRSALLLTFASEPDIQQQAARLDSAEHIIRFCDQFPDLTYVIDQFNALEQDMTKDSTEMLAMKASVHKMINSATFNRALVKAASANNLTARVIHDKQLNMNIQTLFGGMDQVTIVRVRVGSVDRVSDVDLLLLLCPGGNAALVSPPCASSGR
ncbi:MAG: hypothetical protein Q7T57_05905 [Dehalococcoidales bacterium]|nr:hypothetical protein [Dehalococcoidales bacterium]